MRQQINLYRPERMQSTVFSAGALLRVCTVLVVAMLLTYGFALHRLAGVDSELQLIARQEAAVVGRLATLRPTLSAAIGAENWSERLDAALRTLEEKQTVLSLVQGSALGDTRGFSRHLRSLARQSTAGLWLTHIVLSGLGDRTRLEGRAVRAELVPAYVQHLTREPPFTAQRFHRFQIDRPEESTGETVAFAMDSAASQTTERTASR